MTVANHPQHPGSATHRGGSPRVWNLFNTEVVRNSLRNGWYDQDDFMALVPSSYTFTNTTPVGADATFVQGNGQGGTALLSSISATTGEGGQIQRVGAAFKPQAGSNIVFETKLQLSNIRGEIFIGLSELDPTLIATPVNSSDNHIGFESIDSATGAITGVSEKATVRGTVASLGNFVAATDIKLAFRVIGVTRVEFFVNGVMNSSVLLAANIPIVALSPSFVCQVSNGVAGIMTIDWWRCYQELYVG